MIALKLRLVIGLTTFLIINTASAQSHYLAVRAGYTKSMPGGLTTSVNSGSDGFTISQREERFKGLDGFQIGVAAHIDGGSDFTHIDLGVNYSQYGFQDNANIVYDYIDIDFGLSNFFAEAQAPLIIGVGVTPSIVVVNEQIEDLNNFDLKGYLLLGFRAYKNIVFYAKARLGFLEIINDSELRNFQVSLNASIPIFSIKS